MQAEYNQGADELGLDPYESDLEEADVKPPAPTKRRGRGRPPLKVGLFRNKMKKRDRTRKLQLKPLMKSKLMETNLKVITHLEYERALRKYSANANVGKDHRFKYGLDRIHTSQNRISRSVYMGSFT